MRAGPERRDARRADDEFRRLMEDEAFRGFVWRQLTRAHVHETSFHGDALVMAFREGERNAGLALLHDVSRLCPRHYATMADEAARREAARREAARKEAGQESEEEEQTDDE